MILNLGSLAFNCDIQYGGGTPAWGTELGQGEGYRFSFEDTGDFLSAMLYCSIPDTENVKCPLGKGGQQTDSYEFVVASIFTKVFINGTLVPNGNFLLLIVKKLKGAHHVGRRTIKYNPNMTYMGKQINRDCFDKMEQAIGLNSDSAWFIYQMTTKNQDELHFSAYILDKDKKLIFESTESRRSAFLSALKQSPIATSSPSLQKIYFGNPGSGKSYKVETDTRGKKVFRTTFHPDSDYSTFVGTYKPLSDGTSIRYTFVPQTFTNAYIEAYKDIDTPVYLIIEEINRGNCAQIFGDLFQLLDRRNDGYSEYPINADKDLRDYIRTELARYKGIDPDIESEGIEDGKLRLPPNLHILATMNTSDQSLFPMDSAFKRRWDWEYVPIKYSGATSDHFAIKLSDKRFRWIDFLKAVNDRIRRVTESEDKQLGNYFIKSNIDENEFKSKVMFYLWSEVCKNEYLTEQNFMRSMSKESMKQRDSEERSDEFFRAHISEYSVEEFSFNDLFTDRGSDLLLGFMYSMNVLPIQTGEDGTPEP